MNVGLKNNHRARLVGFVKLVKCPVSVTFCTGVLAGVINFTGEINE